MKSISGKEFAKLLEALKWLVAGAVFGISKDRRGLRCLKAQK